MHITKRDRFCAGFCLGCLLGALGLYYAVKRRQPMTAEQLYDKVTASQIQKGQYTITYEGEKVTIILSWNPATNKWDLTLWNEAAKVGTTASGQVETLSNLLSLVKEAKKEYSQGDFDTTYFVTVEEVLAHFRKVVDAHPRHQNVEVWYGAQASRGSLSQLLGTGGALRIIWCERGGEYHCSVSKRGPNNDEVLVSSKNTDLSVCMRALQKMS